MSLYVFVSIKKLWNFPLINVVIIGLNVLYLKDNIIVNNNIYNCKCVCVSSERLINIRNT